MTGQWAERRTLPLNGNPPNQAFTWNGSKGLVNAQPLHRRFDGRWRCAESAPPERDVTVRDDCQDYRAARAHGRSLRPGRKYKMCCLEKDNAALTAANARAAADAAERPAEAVRHAPKRTTKHQTEQPWKASTSRVFVPRPRGPRRWAAADTRLHTRKRPDVSHVGQLRLTVADFARRRRKGATA